MDGYLPLDVWRYCPFCGADSFRSGGENYMQCGVCRKKFYINAACAVACIIENPQGEILLSRRAFDPAKGMLDLPGGFVDVGETAEEAVRREIKEELNLDVTEARYVGSSPNRYPYGGITYFTLDMGFRCTVADFANIRAADDVEGYVFLPPGSINLHEIGFTSIRSILKLYLGAISDNRSKL